MKRIAFLQFGALGDVLYATPILRQVRANNPNALINWFIERKFEDLIKYNYMLDGYTTWDHNLFEGHSKQDKELKMWADMKKAAQDYDKIVSPQWWPDCLIPWDCEDDFLTMMMKTAGLDHLTKRNVMVYTTDEIRSEAKFLFGRAVGHAKKAIAINHHSYTNHPAWSLEAYGELAETLFGLGIRCIFSSGSSDPFPKNIPEQNKFTGSFLLWKEMIELSNLWLGLDTGTMALACSTSTPIITLRNKLPYPLKKTGIRAMGLRDKNVTEIEMGGGTTISVSDLAKMIVRQMS